MPSRRIPASLAEARLFHAAGRRTMRTGRTSRDTLEFNDTKMLPNVPFYQAISWSAYGGCRSKITRPRRRPDEPARWIFGNQYRSSGGSRSSSGVCRPRVSSPVSGYAVLYPPKPQQHSCRVSFPASVQSTATEVVIADSYPVLSGASAKLGPPSSSGQARGSESRPRA